MLPLGHRIAFALFAIVALAIGGRGFFRIYRRIRAGSSDPEPRLDHLPSRIWYALETTLLQTRTFRRRTGVSLFHSFIFYGFVFYMLVNLIDALEGYLHLSIASTNMAGATYNLLADVLSALVLIGVIALVVRRFLLPARRDFRFNERTLLHEDVRERYISLDSLFVSCFILFHVGCRAIGAGAKSVAEGPDRFQPFAGAIAFAIAPEHAEALRIFGYWGALGSVLAFLVYFPYSKHIHIFMAPIKYLVSRDVGSGVLPKLEITLDTEGENKVLGAERLEDLSWPRLLDAYACIQCNRCQDVCPASATGKSLSPAALEINKRMELNQVSRKLPSFENGAQSPRPLLAFALSAEAAWACTTCGACMEVCPVQNEQMLDIVDIRRQQVMVAGEFPAQLQTAFRGMERSKNPWGINHDQRLAWAEGLRVPTIEENPEPEVLYWVGCAASYDPQAQKTARAFVQLLDKAGVNFAVLGKQECCTGDSARRAGNEYLYRQLADQNVATLDRVKPKQIVATCPHCMNSIGKEYRQIGGDYQVTHHSEYLASLVATGKLKNMSRSKSIAYHDPCYLGRHNEVYDAPRNVLKVLSNDVVELDRTRSNSFCCGAGGAQFWKEEEEGEERVSQNRFREVEHKLSEKPGEKVLAVGCPFCKSMFESSPGKNTDTIAVKDIAELLLESIGAEEASTTPTTIPTSTPTPTPAAPSPAPSLPPETTAAPAKEKVSAEAARDATEAVERKKWSPKTAAPETNLAQPHPATEPALSPSSERRKWSPKATIEQDSTQSSATSSISDSIPATPETTRKKWRSNADGVQPPGKEALPEQSVTQPQAESAPVHERKKWVPRAKPTDNSEK